MVPALFPAGTLQLDMGCLTEAGTNLQRSFDIRAKLLGGDNPRTQVSLGQTSLCLHYRQC